MLKIGNIKLDMPVIQAPLSGYTDVAMRKLAREFTAPLTFTGVMLAKSCANPRVIRRQSFQPWDDEPRPVGAQIMGRNPENMLAGAKALREVGFDLLDLNFACPAPKVLKRQRGGFMMQEPELVMDIFRRVRDIMDIPVTMKIRIGYGMGDENHDKFWQICDMAAAENIDALFIHGRTTLQKYAGAANWNLIKLVKEKYPNTPVIGSGDLFKAGDVIDKMNYSKCDGVIIARGAIGNPWIFPEIRELIQGKELPENPTIRQQGLVMLHHFNMLYNIYKSDKTIGYFRKFSARYARRHEDRKKVALALIKPAKKQEFYDVIKEHYGVTIDDLATLKTHFQY